ncbi:hypothetical protein Daus18300_007508 [Diaporthe australafricana]|uniref:F-box domain-containing protein n=1 Tax=Diaporthe australafricana TaxID=127596 RepID=A0ABR3WM28_9PEZI
MAQRNLADLPVEILQHIARLVRDTHRPSFYAFCVTNKRYRLTFVSLIFHELHVSVNDCRALQNDVNLLLESLLSTVCGGDVTQHVRHLCLKGSLSPMKSDGSEVTMTVTDDSDATTNHEDQLQRLQLEGLDELLDEHEPLLDTSLGEEDHLVTPEENAAWIPVANLIKTLPNLARLVYNCHNQFPPSLLNVLHSHRPQCRLYHHSFRLRSLRSKFDRLDPHELAVATSPCLYSVKLRCGPYDEDGEPDQNPQAIWELVAGLAPNLKEVSVLYLPITKYQYPSGEQRWQGLPGFARGQTGSLTLLSVAGIVPPPLESLHILLMRRHHVSENVDPHANDKHINAATAFFDSLRPLRKLSVAGSILPEILDAILSRHGRTVVDLKLCPFEDPWARMTDYIPYVPMTITKAHILQINDNCPALESLSIYIKRTKSDASEVELYTSLARLRPLRSLFLTLDCSNWRVRRDPDLEDEAWFDEDDKRKFDGSWRALRRGHVRQSFINCAVDETLARSIWDVIATRKDGKRLLSLKLHTTGAMNFGMPGRLFRMADIVHHLSRSWLIERGVRDDEQDALHVRELGLEARKARDKELQDKFEAEGGAQDYEEPHAGVQVFRRIWPEKEVGRHWKDDWTSYPLQI